MVARAGVWAESLTAELEVGGAADDGAAAVDGQALVGAGVAAGLRPADHQVPRHQRVAGVQAHLDLRPVHTPPGTHPHPPISPAMHDG